MSRTVKTRVIYDGICLMGSPETWGDVYAMRRGEIVAAVLAQNPLHRPEKLKKSPAPFVHAATKAMRQLLWEGYALFVAAYRSAAERLKAGDTAPPFPAGCFPPALPFVSG